MILLILIGLILLVGLGWRNRQPDRRYPWKGVGFACLGLVGFILAVVFANAIAPKLAGFVLLGFLVLLAVVAISFAIKQSANAPPSAVIPHDRNVKRGSRLVETRSLQSYLEAKQRQALKQSGQVESQPRLSIAGVKLPTDLENLGIFAIGGPGSGKSQAIAQLLSEIQQRPDFRVIVFDRNGEFLEKFYQPNDLLFNPADVRSVSWSHRNERARPETIAASLIPDATGDEAFFSDAARSLLADLYERCDNNAEIWEILAGFTIEELCDFVQGGLSHRYFISEKTGGSVLSTLINYARFYKELPDAGEPISFVEWAQSGDPRSLWLPLFEEDSELYKPLYSAAFELVLKGLLSNEGRQIKTAVVIDELGALNRLRSLSRLLSESRKFLGCPILGTQTEAQLRKTYGDEDTRIVLQGSKTKLILNCGDPDTAELGANLIGRQERIDRNISHSSAGAPFIGSVSKSESIRETYAVMPSELQALPKLHGYLTISDGTPAAKVQITPKLHPSVASRLERRRHLFRVKTIG